MAGVSTRAVLAGPSTGRMFARATAHGKPDHVDRAA